METIFGVKWPVGTPIELVFGLIVFSLVIILFTAYQYIVKYKTRRHNDRQTLKFHLTKLGLSGYQIDLFYSIMGILRATSPVRLLNDPGLFERSISELFAKMKHDDLRDESILQQGCEVAGLYTKLYHRLVQKQIASDSSPLAINQPVCVAINQAIYIGKIFNIRGNDIGVELFFGSTAIDRLKKDEFVKITFWRVNDAEYEFDARIAAVKPPEITVIAPAEIKKSLEFRHPLIDVDIPCRIRQVNEENVEEEISYDGFLLKVNEYEASVRIPVKLEYNYQYFLEFELVQFSFILKTHLISESSLEKDASYQCSLRIDEISPAAKGILGKYISDRL